MTYTLEDLLTLMARLRDPDFGCPWDLQQDFLSITSSTIEEVYEVVDTIEREDYAHLAEELGDLLFQIVFYSQLGREKDIFQFDDVVNHITKKLLRRHPHVFPDGTLESRRNPDEPPDTVSIKDSWEKIKQSERAQKGANGILDDVPVNLPTLIRATKIQKRAAKQGFDWTNANDVLTKIREEVDELEVAIDSKNSQHIADELGDLMFTCVNLARHLNVDSEKSLRSANVKFERRIRDMEASLNNAGEQFSDARLERLEELWAKAKQKGL